MSMKQWAEDEVKIACSRLKKDEDYLNGWGYGGACYESALKAYKSLCDDEHSGTSFNLAASILNKLIAGKPLSLIEDEDFFISQENMVQEDSNWLKNMNLKSCLQCPRQSSLFRYEDLNGNVTYKDVNRVNCISPDCQFAFHSGLADKIIDEMFPITMPYYPNQQFTVITEEILFDEHAGDYDTIAILTASMDDEVYNIYRFFKEGDNHEFIEITHGEFLERKQVSDSRKV